MRTLVLTGPGGAGTSTVAAATAVHAARRGRKTLLLDLTGPAPATGRPAADPAAATAPVGRGAAAALAVQDPGDGPVEVEPGLSLRRPGRDPALWQRDAAHLGRVLGALGVGADVEEETAADLLRVTGMERAATDVAALLAVRDEVRTGSWDLLVVDAGPLQQALRLLALPGEVVGLVDRMLPAERRVVGLVARAVGAAAPAGAVDGMLRLRADLTDAADLLADPFTSVRPVLPVAPWAGDAARDALTAVAVLGVRADAVVVGPVVPPGGDGWQARRARSDEEAVAGLRAAVAPLPLAAVPATAGRPCGVDDLAALAEHVVPEPAADPVSRPELPAPVTVVRDGEGFVLRLALPFVGPQDVSLARRGDDLLLRAGEHRRSLPLASALRRCTVEGARLADGVLALRFVPDPARWRAS